MADGAQAFGNAGGEAARAAPPAGPAPEALVAVGEGVSQAEGGIGIRAPIMLQLLCDTSLAAGQCGTSSMWLPGCYVFPKGQPCYAGVMLIS